MFRSYGEDLPGAAASAVAYMDERRARRLGISAQLEVRDRAAARLSEAVLHYERHVLAWHALGRHADGRAARAAIAVCEQALLDAQPALAAPAPRRPRARSKPPRRQYGTPLARSLAAIGSPAAM